MEVEYIKATRSDVSSRASKAERRIYRVAAYCRVSTDAPEQKTSYESQISTFLQTRIGPLWTSTRMRPLPGLRQRIVQAFRI